MNTPSRITSRIFHGKFSAWSGGSISQTMDEAVSLTLTSASGFLFDYPFSRNTGRWSTLSVTFAVWLLLLSDPPFVFVNNWMIACTSQNGFRFLGAIERGDFPLGIPVDVTSLHSGPTPHVRWVWRAGIRTPLMHTSTRKRSEGVMRFSFPEDLQTRGGLVPGSIHLAVHSVDSLLLVTNDLRYGRSPRISLVRGFGASSFTLASRLT